MEKDELKGWLAQGWSLEQIGRHVGKHPATVSYWLKKHGLAPTHHERHAAKGAIAREELERAVADGLSIGELAELFNRSKGTVRHWLGRYGLRTKNRVGRSRFDVGEKADRGPLTGVCERRGEVEFVPRADGGYRCRRCRVEMVSNRRRVVKAKLVAEAGGACRICGYDSNQAALQFHHLDPATKAFAISHRLRSLEAARVEARQCILLCANCHAEVEAGLAEVPLE